MRDDHDEHGGNYYDGDFVWSGIIAMLHASLTKDSNEQEVNEQYKTKHKLTPTSGPILRRERSMYNVQCVNMHIEL